MTATQIQRKARKVWRFKLEARDVKPRAPLGDLGRPLLGCAAVTPNRVDGVLSTSPADVNLSPPDEVAARPELRPVATGREDDLEISHFWLLTLSVAACSSRRFSDIETGRDDPGPTGRHHPSVVNSASSRLLLTADWRPSFQTGPPPFSGCELHATRSTERLRQPREHHKVDVKLDALQSVRPAGSGVSAYSSTSCS
jgi:hypothetical protein